MMGPPPRRGLHLVELSITSYKYKWVKEKKNSPTLFESINNFVLHQIQKI